MSTVKQRLEKKGLLLDKWSAWEKLNLVSAIIKYGEHNWNSVSVAITTHPRSATEVDVIRPPDWFAPRNCAFQYRSLLKNHIALKGVCEEMLLASLYDILKQERCKEVQIGMFRCQSAYMKEKHDIALCNLGLADNHLEQWDLEMKSEERQREREAAAYALEMEARGKRIAEANGSWSCNIQHPSQWDSNTADHSPNRSCLGYVLPSTTLYGSDTEQLVSPPRAAPRLTQTSKRHRGHKASNKMFQTAPLEVVWHPEYQEMWFQKDTESDEIVEVVELEPPEDRFHYLENSEVPLPLYGITSPTNMLNTFNHLTQMDCQAVNYDDKTKDQMEIIVTDNDQEFMNYGNLKSIDVNEPRTSLIIIRGDEDNGTSRKVKPQTTTCHWAAEPKSVIPSTILQLKPRGVPRTITSSMMPQYPAVEEHEYLLWKKSITNVWKQIASHRHANLFLKPFGNRMLPLYLCNQKVDLITIKRRIDSGVIRNTFEFQRDVMSMFCNDQMPNGHDKHNMGEMQRDTMSIIEAFLRSQLSVRTGGCPTTTHHLKRFFDQFSTPDCPVLPVENSLGKRKLATDFPETPNKKQKLLAWDQPSTSNKM